MAECYRCGAPICFPGAVCDMTLGCGKWRARAMVRQEGALGDFTWIDWEEVRYKHTYEDEARKEFGLVLRERGLEWNVIELKKCF